MLGAGGDGITGGTLMFREAISGIGAGAVNTLGAMGLAEPRIFGCGGRNAIEEDIARCAYLNVNRYNFCSKTGEIPPSELALCYLEDAGLVLSSAVLNVPPPQASSAALPI
jgi:hypothetical protein